MNTSAPETSASLLLRVRDPRDFESWKTFEHLYGRVIRSYCARWQLQPSDADDVVQDVLASVSQAIRSFDYDPQRGRFRAWLGTVVANRIKKFGNQRQKRLSREQSQDANDHTMHVICAEPDHHWVELFSMEVLREACRIVKSEFQAQTWLCFQRSWFESAPPTEIARSLNITVHAVYVNKSRVLKRLEQEVRYLANDLNCDFADMRGSV